MKLSKYKNPGLLLAGLALIIAAPFALADDTKRSAGETVDDTTVNSSVKAHLAEEESVHARNINIETNKGRVALIGYVRSEAQHAAALRIAGSVDGVVEVVDALLIVPEKRSTGTTLDDQTIETKLKFSLTEGGMGEAFAIVTEVRNGEVLLGGFVDSADVKKHAGDIASGIDGVSKVHNRLAVK